MQNTKSILRKSPTGQIVIAGVLIALLIGVAFAVVNIQGDDNNAKPVKESNITVQLNDTDALLFDAQIYASHMNVSVDEKLSADLYSRTFKCLKRN